MNLHISCAPLLCKRGGNAFRIDTPHVLISSVRQPYRVQTELDHPSAVTDELLHYFFLIQLGIDLRDRKSRCGYPDETVAKREISIGVGKAEINRGDDLVRSGIDASYLTFFAGQHPH